MLQLQHKSVLQRVIWVKRNPKFISHKHLINYCQLLLGKKKFAFITSAMRALVRFVNHFHLKLRNMFHFFACHLISDSSSCFFLLSFFPLLIITTFHHSCVHHHHHHRLFAFHNNRDLKLIWMNIEFHALLQNVCVCPIMNGSLCGNFLSSYSLTYLCCVSPLNHFHCYRICIN